jgi:hypothetical protein
MKGVSPVSRIRLPAALSALLVGVVLLQGGCRTMRPPACGTLEISFRILDPLKADDERFIDPQTVVWIEDAKGRYVRSLLVSDWLALGGWRKKLKHSAVKGTNLICPEWQKASRWPGKHSEAAIDAVTKATPSTGKHAVTASCADLGMRPGEYRYYVQSCYTGDGHYVLYSGQISVGETNALHRATARHNPGRLAEGGDILSGVAATYRP